MPLTMYHVRTDSNRQKVRLMEVLRFSGSGTRFTLNNLALLFGQGLSEVSYLSRHILLAARRNEYVAEEDRPRNYEHGEQVREVRLGVPTFGVLLRRRAEDVRRSSLGRMLGRLRHQGPGGI